MRISRDRASSLAHYEAQAMLVPMILEKVRRQGRAGIFQVSRVDHVRQIADLLPLGAGCFSEHDVPFAVLKAVSDYQSDPAPQSAKR